MIEGESDIHSVAGKQFCLLDAFGHAPADGIVCDRFLPPLAGTVGVDARQDSGIGMASWSSQHGNLAEFFIRFFRRLRAQFQFDVLLFHHSRRGQQSQVVRGEDRFWIAYAERFELSQGLEQAACDLIEWQFGVEFEDRFEVSQGQTRAGVIIQMRT